MWSGLFIERSYHTKVTIKVLNVKCGNAKVSVFISTKYIFYNNPINHPFIIRLHRGNACIPHAVRVRACCLNGCCNFPAVGGVNDIPVPARNDVFRQIAHIIDNNGFVAGQHFLYGDGGPVPARVKR